MRYAKFYVPLLLAALVWLTVRPLFEDQSLGSKHRPIQFLLTPSVDAQKVSANGEALMQYLHERTGLYFRSSVPSNFIAVVEAFGSGQADLAIMNTFSYLLANSKYNAHAMMKVVRRNGELSYRGQIIAHVESGIASIQDLRGRRMAFVDPSSTSGYIYPKALLSKSGIQTGEEVFANKHDNVVTMIYQRQVDAGATYYSPPDTETGEILDARARVRQQFPDVFSKIKIIQLTDEIPNDPVVVRDGFPLALQDKILKALLDYSATPAGKASLKEIASVEGLTRSNDEDYAQIRALIRTYSVDVERVLSKKK